MLTGTSACSRVGSDSQTFSDDGDYRNKKGLFLNLGASSQCQGTVTAWHLRYKLDDCRSRKTFSGVLAVYRPVNNLTIEIVPNSTKSVMITCDDDGDDERTRSLLLVAEEQFMIQRGDVIAVCLPKRYRLQMLEDVRSEIKRNASVYEYIYKRQKSAVNGCKFNKLQTIESQSLRARNNYRLHVHVDIAGKYVE